MFNALTSEIFFATAFFSFPIAIFATGLYLGHTFTKISVCNILLVSSFLFAYIGIAPLFYHWDEQRWLAGVNDRQLMWSMLLMSTVAIFFFFLGSLVGTDERATVKNAPPYDGYSYSKVRGCLLFMFPLYCLSLMLFIRAVETPALFIALNLLEGDAGIARGLMSTGFSGYHWYKTVNQDLLLFSTLVAVAYASRFGGTVWLAGAYCLLAFFSMVLTTEKAPAMWLIIGCYFVARLSRGYHYMSMRALVVGLFFILVILTMFYIIFMSIGLERTSTAFLGIFSRVFAGSVQPLYHYLEFAAQKDMFSGLTFPNPASLLPHEPVIFTQEVFAFVHPELLEKGFLGSMPVAFWGEAYLNFRWPGVVVVSFLIGIVARMIDRLFASAVERGSVLSLSLYVYIILRGKDLSVTGFSGYLFDSYLIAVVILFLCLHLICNQARHIENIASHAH